jgi:hypothetical protein
MKASRNVLILAALALLAVAVAPTASSANGPIANAARKCSVNDNFKALGPTYTKKLSVSGTTCSGGRNLIRKWDNCRRKRGGYGKGCPRVLRYRCSERRYRRLSQPYKQYTTDVRCKRGGRRVNFTAQIFKADR